MRGGFTESSSSTNTDPVNRSACPIDHGSKNEEQDMRRVEKTEQNGGLTQLDTTRVVSSIPRYRAEAEEDGTRQAPSKASACPMSDSPTKNNTAQEAPENWIYPSTSQFYEALKRKNRNPKAEDMYTVVPIHNAVNERVWNQVLQWEASFGKGSFDRWPRSGKSGPMLCSFRGRPNDLSPRAWIKVLSGYQAPFDRHDWEVIRPTEQRMRYVVDFYAGRGAGSTDNNSNGIAGGTPPNLAFYLDVRPALDSWEGVRMRFLCATQKLFKSFSLFSSSSSSQTPEKKS